MNDTTKRYRQVILIPKKVTPTIFSLPCVFSVHKEADGICYLLYDWDEQGNYIELRPGQYLCEDYDGKWEVKNEKDIKNNRKHDTLRQDKRRRADDQDYS